MKKHILNSSAFGLYKTLGYACGVAFLLSCEAKTKEEVAPVVTEETEVVELTSFLAASTGIKAKNIAYDAVKKTFILDDDLLVAADDARERLAAQAGRGAQEEHWRSSYLVSNTHVTNIDYFFDSSVPAAWVTATRAGISNWNAVNGTKLFLRETPDRTLANVVVTTGYAEANWIAQAYLPSYSGRPGRSVTINTKFNSLSTSYKEFTMTHEMGHIHGLYHTNQTQGVFIEGTPSSDPRSVMNATVLPWAGFTAGDIKAVQTIYPE